MALQSTSPTSNESTAAAARLAHARAEFDRQLAALEARGADAWDGRELTAAKLISAEANGANEAGNPIFAEKRLAAAQDMLTNVQKRATPRGRESGGHRRPGDGCRSHAGCEAGI